MCVMRRIAESSRTCRHFRDVQNIRHLRRVNPSTKNLGTVAGTLLFDDVADDQAAAREMFRFFPRKEAMRPSFCALKRTKRAGQYGLNSSLNWYWQWKDD
jgi:hypothetical protein